MKKTALKETIFHKEEIPSGEINNMAPIFLAFWFVILVLPCIAATLSIWSEPPDKELGGLAILAVGLIWLVVLGIGGGIACGGLKTRREDMQKIQKDSEIRDQIYELLTGISKTALDTFMRPLNKKSPERIRISWNQLLPKPFRGHYDRYFTVDDVKDLNRYESTEYLGQGNLHILERTLGGVYDRCQSQFEPLDEILLTSDLPPKKFSARIKFVDDSFLGTAENRLSATIILASLYLACFAKTDGERNLTIWVMRPIDPANLCSVSLDENLRTVIDLVQDIHRAIEELNCILRMSL